MTAPAQALRDRLAADPPWAWAEEDWRAIVGRVRAGRSLKPAAWPGGACCAVALSVDCDHETGPLRDREFGVGELSRREFGARVATPRILSLLAERCVPATFFVPAVAAMLYPDEARRIAEQGCEIGLHGWIHERPGELAPQVERELMLRAADALDALTGRRPLGLRTPSWELTDATLAICREMGLVYDSSLMADTEPYEILIEGAQSGLVELPVEWIRDDAAYFPMQRFSALRPFTPPSAVLGIFIEEFDRAYAEGGLFQLTLHPHQIGHRSRIGVLERLIAHILDRGGAWFATHLDVALHCARQGGLTSPSRPADAAAGQPQGERADAT